MSTLDGKTSKLYKTAVAPHGVPPAPDEETDLPTARSRFVDQMAAEIRGLSVWQLRERRAERIMNQLRWAAAPRSRRENP